MKLIRFIENPLFIRVLGYVLVGYGVIFDTLFITYQYSLLYSILITIIILYLYSCVFIKNLKIYDDRIEFIYITRPFFRHRVYLMENIKKITFETSNTSGFPNLRFKICSKTNSIFKYKYKIKACDKYNDFIVLKYFKKYNVEIKIIASDKEKEWYLSKINEPID